MGPVPLLTTRFGPLSHFSVRPFCLFLDESTPGGLGKAQVTGGCVLGPVPLMTGPVRILPIVSLRVALRSLGDIFVMSFQKFLLISTFYPNGYPLASTESWDAECTLFCISFLKRWHDHTASEICFTMSKFSQNEHSGKMPLEIMSIYNCLSIQWLIQAMSMSDIISVSV